MLTPIKPGTARRLGLKQPTARWKYLGASGTTASTYDDTDQAAVWGWNLTAPHAVTFTIRPSAEAEAHIRQRIALGYGWERA